MKKLIWTILMVLSFVAVADAKYNPPAGFENNYGQVTAEVFFMNLNIPPEKSMTFGDYSRYKPTRNDRRNMREDQKNGVYKSAAERFKEMDSDDNGEVNLQELSKYIGKLRSEGRQIY